MTQQRPPHPPNVEEDLTLRQERSQLGAAFGAIGAALGLTLRSLWRLSCKAIRIFWERRGRRWKDTSLNFARQAWQAFLEDVMHTR